MKIMPAFLGTGLDQEPVRDVELERLGVSARNGGFHAPNSPAINEICYGNGIGIGHQMPEGQDMLIFLPGIEGNDLELGEPERFIETEHHRRDIPVSRRRTGTGTQVRPGQTAGVMDINRFGLEPLREAGGINSRQYQQHPDEQPLSLGHKSTAGAAAVRDTDLPVIPVKTLGERKWL